LFYRHCLRAQPPLAHNIRRTRVADIVKTGKLRLGLFPPQYVKDRRAVI
jgi:hypothetical protein